MAIDWTVVTSTHVERACDEYDSGARPARTSGNTFLLARGHRYPAKYIRGRAYKVATGEVPDSNAYSGGEETARFLLRRGFIVEHKGEIIPPTSALAFTRDRSEPRRSRSALRIGLLSFAVDKKHPERTRGNESVVLDVLQSNPELDLLVAAGWTVFGEKELGAVLAGNRNQRTVALLETWKDREGGFEHRGHAIQGSDVLVSRTPQVFATSSQVNGDPELMSALLDEIEARRRLRIGGRSVTWLICGEINVIANVQSDGNRAKFRFAEDPVLSARWQRIFEGTDVFVDPTHTVMGNQGKLAKRRELLSSGGRVFCSVSNVDVTERGTEDVRERLGQVPVQYFWEDGAPHVPDAQPTHNDTYILRTYSI